MRWLTLVGFALTGCAVSLDVPVDAQISCETTSECPAGFTCRNQRCVDPTNLDSQAPELTDAPTVEGSPARAGSEIVITLHTTEEVDNAVVTFGTDVPTPLSAEAVGPLIYEARYAVTGDENSRLGGVVGVDVAMTDHAGNTLTRRQATFVTLDFTPPSLAGASVSPAVVAAGRTLDVFVTASEPLAAAPSLTFSPGLTAGTTFALSADSGTLNYRFAHSVAANDPLGDQHLGVHLVDAAGNAADIDLGDVELDPLPLIVSSVVTDRGRYSAQAGFSHVIAAFDSTKDLDAAPAALTATLGSQAMSCGPYSPTSPSYVCSYDVIGTEIPPATEQALTLIITARDGAGNLTSASTTVVIDTSPPAVVVGVAAYVPSVTNPLPVPARATTGTTVTVTAVSNEEIDTAFTPTLSATRVGGGGVLSFTLRPSSLTAGSAVFDTVLGVGVADGDYTPELQWSDRAGNIASPAALLTPLTIGVKTSLPALVIDQNNVTFLRSPVGMDGTESLATGGVVFPAGPFMTLGPHDPLIGGAELAPSVFSLADGSPITTVRAWTTIARSELVGTLRPTATGWPRSTLVFRDIATLWLTALDNAGNESVPVKIDNGEWVATSKSVLNTSSRFDAFDTASTSLTPRDPPGIPGARAGDALDGTTASASTVAVWHERRSGGSVPEAPQYVGAAYDVARDRVVLITAGASVRVYEYDGDVWSDVTPSLGRAPTPRPQFAIAYEGMRGRVVLYGGAGGLDDFWEWDGTTWNQVPRNPASWPELRAAASMAYDPERGRLVLFGGHDGFAMVDTTWEWDGTSWQQRAVGFGVPRRDVALAYDAIGRHIVVFGGTTDLNFGSAAFLRDDMYYWTGSTWVPITKSGTWPTPRSGAAIALQADGHLVLYGGRTDDFSFVDDTWVWNGASWTPATPSHKPPARELPATAFDVRRGRVVVYDGMSGGNPLGTTLWQWDGADWVERQAAAAVPAIRDSSMTFDAAHRALVITQGQGAGFVPTSDSWSLEDGTWTVRNVGSPDPARSSSPLAYDATHQTLLMFGGYVNTVPDRVSDTWLAVWSAGPPDTIQWQLQSPVHAPGPRAAHMLATVPGGVLLFGGLGINGTPHYQDTYLWNGADWLDLDPQSPLPPARAAAAMVYDPVNDRVWLFGGFDPASGGDRNDLWEFDGSDWAPVSQSGDWPSARDGHALVFDSDRGKVILVGGNNGPTVSPLDDVWEWDGAHWSDRSGTFRPPARSIAATAYDPIGRRVVMFGGQNLSGLRNDTWEADLADGREPAVQLSTSLTSSGIPPESVTSLRVRASCDGSSSSGPGATLVGWSSHGALQRCDGWVDLIGAGFAPCPTGDSTLTPALDMCMDSPARFIRGDGSVAVQCRPLGGSSSAGDASISADYMELRVRYITP